MQFKWKKLGLLFNPTEYKNISWLKEFAQAPSVIIFEDFIRVYFSGRPMPDNKGQYISNTGFVDLDRKNIFNVLRISEKPIMELGKKGTFDEFGIYPTSVIKENNVFYAYYAGWTRCESVPFNVAIGCAVSKNGGETFAKLGEGPILSYSLNEPFILSGPKIRKFNNRYYLFYIAGKRWVMGINRPEPVYQIRMAISDNGLDWEKLDKDLIETKLEDNECQASPDVIYLDGMYHMFFCYRNSLNYKGKEGGYRIGYASSNDLINWKREDEKAGIERSEIGWDNEMVAYPHVFELDGRVYMFYLGNHVGKFGFGAAELIS